jgi:FAD:protein FMN transferase
MTIKISGYMLALLLCCLSLDSCSYDRPSTYQKSKALMDTYITITVVSGSREAADPAIDHAFDVIGRYGDLINFFSDKSELSAVNRNAGIREVRVSPETLDTVEKAVFVSEKSGGAFDPTIGPEIKLWDFVKKIRPTDTEIRKNLPLVNYKNIVIDKNKSTVYLKKKGMLLDLGGIAKGYAADLAVQDLKQRGISGGIVAIAGDIKAFGLKPDKKPRVVGIKNPRQKSSDDEIIARLPLNDKAISTSGDYERYFLADGQRYYHLLIPQTGYPGYACQSVSVVADQGVMTDGFDNAVFILGPEKGLEVARQMGLDAIIIDSRGVVHLTPGLQEILKLERDH